MERQILEWEVRKDEAWVVELESKPALHSLHSNSSSLTGLGLDSYSGHCSLGHKVAAQLKFGLSNPSQMEAKGQTGQI